MAGKGVTPTVLERRGDRRLDSLRYISRCSTKYRKPILGGELKTRLEELLYAKAAELEATIHSMGVMPDHVHLFVESDPTKAPAHIAAQFKGHSSRSTRDEWPLNWARLPSLRKGSTQTTAATGFQRAPDAGLAI
jgi:REP element-mobilizing transposase RayT